MILKEREKTECFDGLINVWPEKENISKLLFLHLFIRLTYVNTMNKYTYDLEMYECKLAKKIILKKLFTG